MRTTDFSRAPDRARAEAMVVVERATGGRSWQRRARDAARAAPGHRWSTAYRLRTGARGLLAWFATAADADAFLAGRRARDERHRSLRAEAEGYTNGVWRAEGDEMAHIERFTPVSREVARGTVPPRVAEPADGSASRRRVVGGGRGPGAASTRRRGSTGSTPGTGGSPADAGAMFVGATRYRGPHSWAVLSRDWYPMVAAMRRLRGYVWHGVYWEAPFTLGTLAFFATRDDLLVFARVPAHRRLMQWITRDRRHGTGGYIRLYVADDAVPGTTGTHTGTGTGTGTGTVPA